MTACETARAVADRRRRLAAIRERLAVALMAEWRLTPRGRAGASPGEAWSWIAENVRMMAAVIEDAGEAGSDGNGSTTRRERNDRP